STRRTRRSFCLVSRRTSRRQPSLHRELHGVADRDAYSAGILVDPSVRIEKAVLLQTEVVQVFARRAPVWRRWLKTRLRRHAIAPVWRRWLKTRLRRHALLLRGRERILRRSTPHVLIRENTEENPDGEVDEHGGDDQ